MQRSPQALPPSFLINPAAMPTRWTGEPWGMRSFQNKNYLNSIWLGTVWNFMILPTRAYYELLGPLMRGDLGRLVGNVFAFITLTIAFFCAGLIGKLVMMPVELEVLQQSYVMNEHEAFAALNNGFTEPVIEVSKLPSPQQ